MKRHRLMSRISLVLGHGGYVLGLLEYGVTDIVWLRIFAIGGCGMVVGYQLLQPRVQWMTASWCFVYVAVNIHQLVAFMGSSPAPLSWEESALHKRFSSHLTVAQFSVLMTLGEWLWLVDGALLAGTEHHGCDECLFFIADGVCDVFAGGRQVAQLGPGSVVGEVAVLCDDACPSRVTTVTALGSVRCFAAPVTKVQELLDARPDMRAPLERLFVDALSSKVLALRRQIQLHKHRATLSTACDVAGHSAHPAGVAAVRGWYGMSENVHVRLMEEVSQCGHKPF